MSGSSERSGHTAAVRARLDGRAIPLAHAGADCGSRRAWLRSTAVVWLVAWAIVRILALGGRRARARRGSVRWRSAMRRVVRSRSSAASASPGIGRSRRYIEEQCPALEDRLATAVEIVARVLCLPMRASAARCWPMPRVRLARCSLGDHRAARAGAACRPARRPPPSRRWWLPPRSGSSPAGRRCGSPRSMRYPAAWCCRYRLATRASSGAIRS